MKEKAIMIATLGRRDVQLVIEDNDQKNRVEIPETLTRKIHCILENHYHQNELRYYYESPLDPLDFENPLDEFIDLDNIIHIKDESQTHPTLYAGLLLEQAQLLKSMYKPQDITIILLNTNRDGLDKEPYAAGMLLCAYFNKMLGVTIYGEEGELKEETLDETEEIDLNGCICYYNYLKNEDRFISYPSVENNLFYRRIDNLFTKLKLDNGFQYKAYTSTTGGIPLLNEAIRSIIHYRLSQDIHIYSFDRDERTKKVKPVLSTEVILPNILFNAKARMEDLIKRGDFHGANAVLDSIGYKKNPSWRFQLKTINQFFNGHIIQSEKGSPEYIQRLDQFKARHSLNIALHVENALHRENYLLAIVYVCSFIDSLLMDLIERLPFVEKVHRSIERIVPKKNENIPDELTTDQKEGQKPMLNQNNQYDRQNNYYRMSTSRKEEWIQFFKNYSNNNLIGDFEKVNKSFDKPIKNIHIPNEDKFKYTLRQIRNMYAHNMFVFFNDTSVEKSLIDFLIEKKIWEKNPSRYSFLGAPLTKSILENLELTDAVTLYNDMIYGIIKEMRKDSI